MIWLQVQAEDVTFGTELVVGICVLLVSIVTNFLTNKHKTDKLAGDLLEEKKARKEAEEANEKVLEKLDSKVDKELVGFQTSQRHLKSDIKEEIKRVEDVAMKRIDAARDAADKGYEQLERGLSDLRKVVNEQSQTIINAIRDLKQ